MHKFKIGDKVKTIDDKRTNGEIKHIACVLATSAGGKACSKKYCTHKVKNTIWVQWQNEKSLFSYDYSEVVYDVAQQPQTASVQKEPALKDAIRAVEDNFNKEAKRADADFFKIYNGFTKVKHDRYGRSFMQETNLDPKPIENNELNHETYSGFKKGSWRKSLSKDSI